MAFNIMDLFGPGALNRLLQPAQQQGVQNFLANPGSAQPGFFNPDRFGGGQGQTNRAPAVGVEALIERLAPPMQVSASGSAGVGANQAMQGGSAGIDPWAGKREGDVVPADQWANMRQPGVDPMVTGSSQAQPTAARPSPFGGLGGMINKEALNDIFTGWAMGSTPSESIAKGAQLVAANRGTRQNVNQTVAWLKGKGMDEQQAKMLASSPPALNEYLKTMAAGSDPQKALELQKTQLEIEKLRNPTEKLTSDQQEYKYAVDQGFKGNFVDYQRQMKEAGRSQVNVDTGVKLPSGFRWADPNNQAAGVEPIPGGPATQLPGELAARIGLADSWLKNDLPAVKKSAEAGDVTGWYDRYQAGNNQSSPQATTYRKIQSGVEVLSRLLSGAGMTQVEIDEKAARYQPTYTDDAKSLSDKIDQLAQEIQATRDSAMQGRGGPVRGQQAPATGGVVDYQEYFKGQ
jgi:predicted transcriptional regulator